MELLKVLVIDDDSAVRDVACEMLANLDCDVASASSGPEGLERLENASYDVIFLDIGMPGMNGLEVHKRVRASAPEQCIVVMTGYSEGDLSEVRDAFTWVLPKPFSMVSLSDTLEQLR